MVVLIELIILTIKLLRRYTENTTEKLPLWFALMFMWLASGIALLILQQVTFRIFINEQFGRIVTWVALSCAGMAAIFINWISFDLTYPNKKKILIIPIIITVVFLLLMSFILIYLGDPFSYIQDGEIFYMIQFQVSSYFFIGLLTFIAPTVFIYFAIKNKDKKDLRNKFLWLAFALYLFGIAYMIEVGPIAAIISVPMRASYIVTTTILYVEFLR